MRLVVANRSDKSIFATLGVSDYPSVDVLGLQYKFVNVGESTRARSRQIGETTWTKAEQGLAGVQSKCYDDAEVD